LTLGHIVSHNNGSGNTRKPCECYRIKLSDGVRLPPDEATSRVAFVFVLLEDGFGDGVFMKLTHDQ
jgi:hypothetical protein